MTNLSKVLTGLIIAAVLVWGVIELLAEPVSPTATTTPNSEITIYKTVKGNMDIIKITKPQANDLVTSPLTITGQARGNWYFEASFPVRLVDSNGKELAIKPAQAQDEWMTSSYVPFEVVLEFTKPATQYGTLILQKDNPSGLPEHDDELRVPVRFR